MNKVLTRLVFWKTTQKFEVQYHRVVSHTVLLPDAGLDIQGRIDARWRWASYFLWVMLVRCRACAASLIRVQYVWRRFRNVGIQPIVQTDIKNATESYSVAAASVHM